MNKSERVEVRRIVKGRFELLRDQLSARAREVSGVIRRQIEGEYKEPLNEAKKRSDNLRRRLKSVVEDTIALHHDMETKGIKAPYSLVEGRKEMGREIESIIGYYLKEWKPVGLDAMVNDRLDQIKAQHGYANLNLRSEEISILEDLAVGSLVSDEAQTFLERVPKVDDFLPLPEGVKLKALGTGV